MDLIDPPELSQGEESPSLSESEDTGATTAGARFSGERAIVHLDVDTFFVQVERNLNPQLQLVPCVVQQHEDIICVSMEAKRLGVKKHSKPNDIKRLFPSVVLVPVRTEFGQKVSYRPYREASHEIAQVLQRTLQSFEADWGLQTGSLTLEKGSIDEFFVDASLAGIVHSPSEDTEVLSVGCASTHNFCELCEAEDHLRRADVLAAELRLAVKKQANYVMSTGVGPNKMLAKLACGIRKYDSRSILTTAHLEHACSLIPFSSFPFIGTHIPRTHRFAFLEALSRFSGTASALDWETTTMTSVQVLPLPVLQQVLGVEAGESVFNWCRGRDSSPVVQIAPPRTLSSSMSLKSLTEVQGFAELERVTSWVTEELFERIQEDRKIYDRTSLAKQRLFFSFRLLSPSVRKNLSSADALVYTESRSVRFEVGLRAHATGVDLSTRASFSKEIVEDIMRHVRRHVSTRWQIRWIGASCEFSEVSRPAARSPLPQTTEVRANFKLTGDSDSLDILSSTASTPLDSNSCKPGAHKRPPQPGSLERQQRLEKFFRKK